MDPRSAHFASPYPQTPTPGGSASAHHFGRPPLTSLKPFGYQHTPRPSSTMNRKPHPLTQVSVIDSLSIEQSSQSRPQISKNDITLTRAQPDDNQSLDADLLEFENEQRRGVSNQRRSNNLQSPTTSDDLTTTTEHEEEDEEEEEEEQDISDDDDHDLSSFRIGLSSLSPPGIGRAATRGHPLDQGEDLSFQLAHDFSRDLSALSLSPIRRPTSKTSAGMADDTQLTLEDDQTRIGHTPASGFEGMARELRREFEQITGMPSPSRSNRDHRKKKPLESSNKKDNSRGGTLNGRLPNGTRAKRVFGSDLANGLNLPRPHQLAPVGLSSTPLSKPIETKQPPLNDEKYNNNNNNTTRPSNTTGLLRFANNPVPRPQSAQPTIRVMDASSSDPSVIRPPQSHNKPKQRNSQSDNRLGAEARNIVGNSVHVPDVTGLTDALRSPDKAEFRSGDPLNGIKFSTEPGRPDPTLNEALDQLRKRLSYLESENEACETRIRDLQQQLTDVRQQPRTNDRMTNGQADLSSKTPSSAIERMVQKLKMYTRRLNTSIEAHAVALDELNNFKNRNKHLKQELGSVKTDFSQWSAEVDDLKHGLEGLTLEVREIRTMIEGLMKTAQPLPTRTGPTQPGMSRRGAPLSKVAELKPPLSKTQQEIKRHTRAIPKPALAADQSEDLRSGIEEWRSQTSSTPRSSGRSFISPDEIQRLKNAVEVEQSIKLASGSIKSSQPPKPVASQSANTRPGPTPSTSKIPPSKPPIVNVGAKATDELSRGEAILNSLPKSSHDDTTCWQCRMRRKSATSNNNPTGRSASAPIPIHIPSKGVERDRDDEDSRDGLPPQTVLVNILKDLEQDFEVHRKIFVELSETYRKMNPASVQVSKRKLLAQHLKESVDTLEKKAGHIKHLYDLLHIKDLPNKIGTDVPDWKQSGK